MKADLIDSPAEMVNMTNGHLLPNMDSTKPATNSNAHPLDPLSPREIQLAVQAILSHVKGSNNEGAETLIKKIYFNSVSLKEPNKYAVLRWANLATEKDIAAVGGDINAALLRQAETYAEMRAHLIDPISCLSYEAIVTLPNNLLKGPSYRATVSKWIVLDGLLQPSLQPEELLWAEEVCKKDAKVKAACKAVGLNQQDIAVDGWCVGHDERFPNRRLQQGFIFARSRPDDNLYAHPCDFVVILDSHTGEVLAIDFPPLNSASAASSAVDYEKLPTRERFEPPRANHNYLPEQVMMDEPEFKLRDTLKPLYVVQPEGVSYQLQGRVLKWQNWSVHIGFSYREGLVLSNITYDDGPNTRPLFYRLSVAEMVVPYSKPTFPHHRKHAFDTGEYGIGALANSLALGCDCLGSITYLDADFVNRAGGVDRIVRAICIHEEDAGILHKHTDFRNMRAHVARNRKLVISSICTVANYEYGFYFNFALDGSIELEVKATGIVNAYCLKPDEERDPAHEMEVAPDIAAQHHQHLFSYRIDPMVDGIRNQVVQMDTVTDSEPVGSKTNFYGNGFHTEKTVYETSKSAVSDYDATKSRAWIIENPNVQHHATRGNVGYKIVSKDMPQLLAKPGSLVWNRAPFARHNIFVTSYRDGEIFPSEVHINQNPGAEDFGLQTWVNRDDNIKNADVVCWPCFGVTHISRPEDWPIMPVEILRVHLKPSGFFRRNPGLDVPSTADMGSRQATEAFAKLAADGDGVDKGHRNAQPTGTNGGGCCDGF